MRNPKRIPKVLKEIEKSWSKEPDWRFGQWFFNTIMSVVGDPFFIEDEDLVRLIKGNKNIYRPIKTKKTNKINKKKLRSLSKIILKQYD